jgi:APA family basic amino acid/polyamine antiporter
VDGRDAPPAAAALAPDAPPTDAASSRTPRRTLGFRDLVLIAVGAVIGSGIFVVPATVLRQTGGSSCAALLVWVAAGVLSFLGALTYGELGAARPEAGGLYAYVRDAFGPLPAFLYGWTAFFGIGSGSVAALARAAVRLGIVLAGAPVCYVWRARRAAGHPPAAVS